MDLILKGGRDLGNFTHIAFNLKLIDKSVQIYFDRRPWAQKSLTQFFINLSVVLNLNHFIQSRQVESKAVYEWMENSFSHDSGNLKEFHYDYYYTTLSF